MRILRLLWAFLTSRWLWSLIGIALLGAIVWLFGPLVSVGTVRPLAGEIALRPLTVFLFPLAFESYDRACRHPFRMFSEDRRKGFGEITGRDTFQIQRGNKIVERGDTTEITGKDGTGKACSFSFVPYPSVTSHI